MSLAAINKEEIKRRGEDKKFSVILEGGVTGSLGIAIGTLRIVYTPEEAAEKIKLGDIMVSPNTTSIWERAMGLASAIVTEIGGTGNHTAVVSREQGKPAIVGSSDALTILKLYDGQTVTVDSLFRRIYLGAVPIDKGSGYVYYPTEIPAQYAGFDSVQEEDHWKGATSAGQTIVAPDGSKWIGKPNERTSLFLNEIHKKSHSWIAKTAGLSLVHDRTNNGIYQVLFADMHGWREELRSKSLDELEKIYQEWVSIINGYLDASQNLSLAPESMERWIDYFIRMNAIMNISFPYNEVVSGLRETAFAQARLTQPYLSQAHSALSAQLGGTLEKAKAQNYKELLEKLRQEEITTPGLLKVLQDITDGKEKAGQLLLESYSDFYQRLENYAQNYRVTKEFALPLGRMWPLKEVATDLINDYQNNRQINVYEQVPEEFFLIMMRLIVLCDCQC